MTDIAAFIKTNYKKALSENLSCLIKEHERITGKSYYVEIPEDSDSQILVSISTDNEKHVIKFPELVLKQVKDASVAEVIIAHEILHTKLETEGFKVSPFSAGWKNGVYNLVVDLIINRTLLPKYNFDYTPCVYKFILKNIEISPKYGFRVPSSFGDNYEKVVVLVGSLLNSKWFWNESHPIVKKILRVMK
jgi:hypothetical protein